MKKILLTSLILIATGCSSFVTRKELNQCSQKCGGEKQISQCHKDDANKMICACK